MLRLRGRNRLLEKCPQSLRGCIIYKRMILVFLLFIIEIYFFTVVEKKLTCSLIFLDPPKKELNICIA